MVLMNRRMIHLTKYKSRLPKLLRLNSNAFLYPIKQAIVIPFDTIEEMNEFEIRLRSKIQFSKEQADF